jgi:hypothetical protein
MMTRKQFIGSLAGLFGATALLGACTTPDEMGEGEGEGSGSGSGSGSGGGGGGGGGGGLGPDAGMTPDAPPAMACVTPASAIGSNHGHVLVISPADLDAGVEKSYNIKGSSAHAHTVVITASMFATLKANRSVQTMSTNDGHMHAVTVTC